MKVDFERAEGWEALVQFENTGNQKFIEEWDREGWGCIVRKGQKQVGDPEIAFLVGNTYGYKSIKSSSILQFEDSELRPQVLFVRYAFFRSQKTISKGSRQKRNFRA